MGISCEGFVEEVTGAEEEDEDEEKDEEKDGVMVVKLSPAEEDEEGAELMGEDEGTG